MQQPLTTPRPHRSARHEPPGGHSRRARRADAGTTLIEILVVVAVIMGLIAVLVPAVAMIRGRVHLRTAHQVVEMLHQSIEAYRQDDGQRRYPPQPNADRSLSRREVDDARTAIGTLELLESRGFPAAAEQRHDGDGRLLDPWGDPYRYCPGTRRSDVVPDGVLPGWNWDQAAARPAAWGRRPDPASLVLGDGPLLYAYVWSTGGGAKTPEAWIHPADSGR